ncbi:MAG TPA: 23S rRNA (pseudouridine(1915)-N(3))-methyltransferase RlmH [Alphaproteobacteria bacterium]|nr:23S rRNA (pseudouridine(1915)-N(3))-methyltransferase RlmH [Alphaproteobacteria bacterium]
MQITVLATGSCRDAHILALEGNYISRMITGWNINVREIRDNPNPDIEATHQLAAWQSLPTPKMLVVLDEKGQSFGSEKFAAQLQEFANRGLRSIAFLIGGADGVSERVKKEAGMVMSLSGLTLPHQLVRVFLAEQLYRAGTIMTNHPYHRV